MELLLYTLIFVFGYLTHKLFHTYFSAKIGSIIFLQSKLISLMMLLKCIEQYTYIKAFGMLQLQEKGASANEIKSYKLMIENDIDFFKKESIKSINRHIPDYLKVLDHFENWDDAMAFAIKYKNEIPRDMLYDKKDQRDS